MCVCLVGVGGGGWGGANSYLQYMVYCGCAARMIPTSALSGIWLTPFLSKRYKTESIFSLSVENILLVLRFTVSNLFHSYPNRPMIFCFFWYKQFAISIRFLLSLIERNYSRSLWCVCLNPHSNLIANYFICIRFINIQSVRARAIFYSSHCDRVVHARGFRQSETLTSQLNYREKLEYWNFPCGKFR